MRISHTSGSTGSTSAPTKTLTMYITGVKNHGKEILSATNLCVQTRIILSLSGKRSILESL
jgi:hypothetical protein